MGTISASKIERMHIYKHMCVHVLYIHIYNMDCLYHSSYYYLNTTSTTTTTSTSTATTTTAATTTVTTPTAPNPAPAPAAAAIAADPLYILFRDTRGLAGCSYMVHVVIHA